MKELEEIYKQSKYIDTLFEQQYNIKSPENIRKYTLELLVELGELANETRCFKFWSNKGPSEKDVILEEYIDCLFMLLYFCNILNVSLEEEFPLSQNQNMVDTFLLLYSLGVEFSKTLDQNVLKRLVVELFHLKDLLNFTMEDLQEETYKKKRIITKRLNSDY